MLTLLQQHKQFWIAALIFIVSGIVAILFNNVLLLAIPFCWVMLPSLLSYIFKNTEQLFFWLLMLLPLSTELNITPSLGIDFPDEVIMILLTTLFIGAVLYQPQLFPITVVKHPLFLIIVLQLIWILITTLFAVNKLIAFKFFLARIWFIVPFVVLPQFFLQSISQIKKAAYYLLIPMGVVVVSCLVQHSIYNFSFEGIKQTMYPFFRNHVNYSAMLVCLLAVLWGIYQLTPSNQKYKKWITALLVLGVIALFFAYSRGAWLSLLIGIITIFIIHQKWMMPIIITTSIVILVFLGWLTYQNNYVKFSPDYQHTIFHTQLGEHLQSTTTLKDLSNAERFYRWVAGINMVIEKPFTGFGPNNFYQNYKSYTRDIFKTYVSDNPEHSSVHNYFLLTALEQGIVGLALLYILIIGMLLYAQYLYHHLNNQFYKTIALTIGVITSMIISINMMSDMIETDKIGSIFWLCVGMIIVLQTKLNEALESIA